MIEKITKKSVFNYIEYGCYCGWGGQGKPLDATDRCCQIHDCCYAKLENHKCSPKLNWYDFSIKKGQIRCVGKTWCERKTCQCDKKIAFCLRKVMKSYYSKYRWYKKSNCKSPTPSCSSVKS
ncbi:group IIE secretory phospholipase A2-like [Macrotis lagotis]|uniref:group IIE secretory phospholipase A2-like n=1 Tax=Macrotis lagotis TaxID=92651 RepID=UPI003D68318C